MLKKRLIPLLFALAYVVVPTSAVYLQVELTDAAVVQPINVPTETVVPAVLRVEPDEREPLTVL